MNGESASEPDPRERTHRSERLLALLATRSRVVLVSHVNPDPDALASMLGLQALIAAKLPDTPIILTVDGMIARAENQAMADLLEIPLTPIESVPIGPDTAVVMVDSQPHTGRRASEAATPLVVLDHHETPGRLEGVGLLDIRPNLGATSTLVTGYLLEQDIPVSKRLATALLYGIESEVAGYPREASPADDGALVWLFPRADKDLLARIRNPKLPYSYFATFHHALANAFLYRDAVLCWCGPVTQPDIIAELADFFIRFDQVSWAVCVGSFDGLLKISARSDHMGAHCGEVLRAAVDGLGTAGGHDKRAGGAIRLDAAGGRSQDDLLQLLRSRILGHLNITEQTGQRLLEASPVIPAP
jgi:nanoRNase/pAp phosphatase (c-di-AMP/oligoRNAs hydrolase)